MHGLGADGAGERQVEGLDTPCVDFVEVHVEGRLVELNDIDARVDEVRDLGRDRAREGKAQLPARAVRFVDHRVDQRHRPGNRQLQPPVRQRAREPHVIEMDRRGASYLARHGWAGRLVAIAADTAFLPLVRVDPTQPLREAVHEVAAGLFPIGHDVDARPQLFADRDAGRVALRFGEIRAFEPPGREDAFGLGEPGRLRKAAGNRRSERHARGLRRAPVPGPARRTTDACASTSS